MSAGPVIVRNWDVPAPGWPSTLDGLRLAHVSDFHFTRWTRAVRHTQSLLKTHSYDFLLVTGDFGVFRRWWRHAAGMIRRFFEPLADRAPIYAVLGNHDDPSLPTADGLPLTFLRNQTVQPAWKGATFNLSGIEQIKCRGGDLQKALSERGDQSPTILLAHYPSTVFAVAGRKVNLVLSGHTHGGQIRLPWLGCIWPNDRIPRHMACGLHRIGDAYVHVSSGIGVSLPLRMRINCPSEIAILTMRSCES